MIVRLQWFINGFMDILATTTILLAINKVQQFFEPPEIFMVLANNIVLYLQFLSFYYLVKVLVKKTWIIKEAIYSMGMLAAGILLGDNITTLTASTAIIMVILRKTF